RALRRRELSPVGKRIRRDVQDTDEQAPHAPTIPDLYLPGALESHPSLAPADRAGSDGQALSGAGRGGTKMPGRAGFSAAAAAAAARAATADCPAVARVTSTVRLRRPPEKRVS